MLQVARVTTVHPEADALGCYQERANGLAAHEAWAYQLLLDEGPPAGKVPVLRPRHQVHDDAVGSVAEARWRGSQFLIGMQACEDDGGAARHIERALALFGSYQPDTTLPFGLGAHPLGPAAVARRPSSLAASRQAGEKELRPRDGGDTC